MQFSKVLISGLAVAGVAQASNSSNMTSTKNAAVGSPLNDKSGIMGAAALAGVVAFLI